MQYLKRRLPLAVLLPFAVNLLANLAYTPIHFGLKNNALASVDIVLVLGSLIWAMVVIRQRARWVPLVNMPYLLWVVFATVLQLSITWLNRGGAHELSPSASDGYGVAAGGAGAGHHLGLRRMAHSPIGGAGAAKRALSADTGCWPDRF